MIEIIDVVKPGMGEPPAIVAIDTKYGHNAAGLLRLCSVLGYGQLWLTGSRWAEGWEKRMPREERMKLYERVKVFRCDRPLDAFPDKEQIVAVEILESAEPLAYFEHPGSPVYVFGPEDGSLTRNVLKECRRRVILPTDSCMNLSSAAALVMGDRKLQRQRAGLECVMPSAQTTQDQRGFLDSDEKLRWD